VGKQIVVAGNLGTGKTTLSANLAARFGGTAFSESPADYPYLEDMYGNMSRWCFNNQLSFMVKKAEEHLRITGGNKLGIQDRGVLETHEVFSQTFRIKRILDDRDFGILDRVFSMLRQHLAPVDVLIFMHAPASFLLARIEKRHRSSEGKVWRSLLEDLGCQYEEWYSGVAKAMPGRTIILDMTKVDFVANPQTLNDICAEVGKILDRSLSEKENRVSGMPNG
jgi:deoxyadenosine/deoxycytidine kinase